MAESLLREPPKLSGGDEEEEEEEEEEGDDEEGAGMGIGEMGEEGRPKHLPCPDEEDLIGFVTTANYDMGKGKAAAIGNIAVAMVVEIVARQAVSSSSVGEKKEKGESTDATTATDATDATAATATATANTTAATADTAAALAANTTAATATGKIPSPSQQLEKGGLCIVRNAGQSVARLARWKVCK